MNKSVSNIISGIAICIILSTCANRGSITGGEKDIEPPEITKESPENFSINFTEDEIRINFNEYIKIKDVQKQLIISPPMKTQPEITPLGGASKEIRIKIYDTLQPNTTYAFNFGQSIVDNNEENPYSFYRYVFSTGDYIDSLSVGGNILDAEKREPDDFISVMLYEVDSTFTDSVIYKETPKYITNTLDSTTTYKLENLKAGKYLLIALKDGNNSNKYEQKTDRIAFKEELITIPTEASFDLKLFKEEADFKVIRPKQVAGNKIAFAYEGNAEKLKINLHSETPDGFLKRVTKDTQADTLYYWYAPKIEADSLLFSVKNKTYQDSMYVNLRDMEKDTLTLRTVRSNLKLDEVVELEGSVPFKAIDLEKISLMDKDSLKVDFKTRLDSMQNRYVFDFEKKEDDNYRMELLPGALTDLFENTNKDTLQYSFRTKKNSDFGNARVNIYNAEYPIIIQLTNSKGDVVVEKYSEKPEPVDFESLNPGKFNLRVIFDTNKNGKWDTGNYLKKIQPERISYYPEELDIRSNWDEIYTFTLK